MPDLMDSKTEKVAEIIQRIHQSEIENLLVVGCGSGLEAAILAQQLNAKVFGIDIESNFDKQALQIAHLQIGDATKLAFRDESFDFVFSYHALEHIESPGKALEEIRRVLRAGGGFWIGAPNRSRVIGYIGAKNASFTKKLKWNLADWRARLRGKFENELGAHAGFTSDELSRLLSDVFPFVEDRTKDYFSTVYANHQTTLNLIELSGLSQFIYPSVYFSGRK